MADKDNGGPVFPTDADNYGPKYCGPGMTLREHFAGMAMAAILANPEFTKSIRDYCTAFEGGPSEIATLAYKQADAMLAAREA